MVSEFFGYGLYNLMMHLSLDVAESAMMSRIN